MEKTNPFRNMNTTQLRDRGGPNRVKTFAINFVQKKLNGRQQQRPPFDLQVLS